MELFSSTTLLVLIRKCYQTSSTTATLLYNLAQNPEQQKKLTEEVFRLLPDIDSPMSKDVLENSPYFRATLKESLRVTPLIVGTMRAAGQDLTLSGYKVPKGVSNSKTLSQRSCHHEILLPRGGFRPTLRCPN